MGTEMKIESKSSIEKEPRTLSLGQIQYAREAALDVLSNKTIEEASSIFTEGLKPVLSINDDKMNLDHSDLSDLNDERRSFRPHEELRDIGSAPF